MITKELLSEGSMESKLGIIKKFLPFCAKRLDLESLPKIKIVADKSYSVQHKSFGGYQPGAQHIILAVGGRHIADVLRTLAHELTHYKQDVNGELEDDSAGDTGSPQENEANSVAGIIMRDFGRANPSIYE
jgi:hypothetical protein